MKKYLLTLGLIILVVGSDLYAQKIITIKERDLDGDTFTDKRNVDINSQLTLRLNRDSLLKRIESVTDTTGLPADVIKLLKVLTDALLKKQEWINGIAAATKAYVPGEPASFTSFITTRARISSEIDDLIRSDRKLFTYFEQEDPLEGIWTQLTNALNKRIKELQEELQNSPKYSDVRVRLGGWLIHNNEQTPLHFDGLDTNPLSEFYEVERWQFAPTKEQLAEIERLQQLVKESELNEANFKDIIKSKYVSDIINEIENNLNAKLEAFKTKIEAVAASAKIPAGIIKNDVQEIVSSTKDLIAFVGEKLKYYKDVKKDPAFSITTLVADIASHVEDFNAKRSDLGKLFSKFKADVDDAKAAVKEAVASFNILGIFKNFLEDLKNNILGQDVVSVLESSKIDDLAREFTDKVIAHTIKSIPEESSTDLRYSGFRQAGDRVVIKLLVTKGELTNQLFQETKDVTLYRILPHVETTVGVIFAHPLRETQIEKDFQMSPYYNALFKGIFHGKQGKSKLRDKTSLNTIWQTSLGLHVSTPDFDKDDVPELGFGFVLSTLKDFLQGGIAYNIFYRAPYVFFGVRLPIGNINLGGNNNPSPPPAPNN